MKKISTTGIDPALIEGKRFESDCLPPIESTDLLCYLVLETSFYTQKQFKAFRSLEAYNQMVSGFVYNVQGHMIASKFVVLAKVRHSQRMNETLIPIWINRAPVAHLVVHWAVMREVVSSRLRPDQHSGSLNN